MQEALWIYGVFPLMTAVVSASLSVFNIVRRYTTKARHALSQSVSQILIVTNIVVSVLTYLVLNEIGVVELPNPHLGRIGSFVLAMTSGLVPIGALSIAPIKKKVDGTETIVSVMTWIHEIVESNIDTAVTQEVVEISLEMENKSVDTGVLRQIGLHVIQHRFASDDRQLRKHAATLERLANRENLAGMIAFLMQYCEPRWLASQADKQTQTNYEKRNPSL